MTACRCVGTLQNTENIRSLDRFRPVQVPCYDCYIYLCCNPHISSSVVAYTVSTVNGYWSFELKQKKHKKKQWCMVFVQLLERSVSLWRLAAQYHTAGSDGCTLADSNDICRSTVRLAVNPSTSVGSIMFTPLETNFTSIPPEAVHRYQYRSGLLTSAIVQPTFSDELGFRARSGVSWLTRIVTTPGKEITERRSL